MASREPDAGAVAATAEREGTTLRLRGALNLGSVPGLQAVCRKAVSAAGLQVDLAQATEVDSSVLALLLALRRDTEGTGGTFAVQNAPAALRTLARLYGVEFLVDNAAPPVQA